MSKNDHIGTRRWDKAKWHLDKGGNARHLEAVFAFLGKHDLLTLEGRDEASGIAGEDQALLEVHVIPKAHAFLDDSYEAFLNQWSSSPEAAQAFLETKWTGYNTTHVSSSTPPSTNKTEGALKRLRARAKKNQVEVEHLLAFASLRDPAAAPVFRSLAVEFRWANESKRTKGGLVIPFGRWADAVALFLEGGYPAMVQRATDPAEHQKDRKDKGGLGEYPLSVLSNVRTPESVRAVLEIARYALKDLPGRLELGHGCAKVWNGLLSFKDAVSISEEDGDDVRRVLHDLLAEKSPSATKHTVYCALRGVGNEDTIERIRNAKPLTGSYKGFEKEVERAIRKRLKAKGP